MLRRRLIQNVIPLLLCWNADRSLAVDFKIDLPPEMGVRVPSVETQKVNVDFPDDLGTVNNGLPGRENEPVQVTDENAVKGRIESIEPLTQRSSRVYDRDFPTPKCLAERVSFWETIYRDIDVDSILLHDRENLGRIYGMARLSLNSQTRTYAANVYRDYYSGKLRELAAIYDKPQEWDSAHRDLMRHFTSKELSFETFMQASKNIRVQSGLKRHFEDGIQRSLPIIGTIHSVVAQQGIPEDIVMLPHVESSYSTRAVSKVGAVGLWQIMPDTMRLLMGKGAVSRRNEVYTSTVAAAKLLKANYAQTKSWPLALTAYNHGVNGVMKAVRQTGSRDLCTIIERYESPSFRFASSNFYAQFLAARNVALPRYAEIIKRGNGPKVLRPMLSRKLGGSF